eukprot:768739-Hanusia_phi.AAC.12
MSPPMSSASFLHTLSPRAPSFSSSTLTRQSVSKSRHNEQHDVRGAGRESRRRGTREERRRRGRGRGS